jgi:hypothetical protein
MANGVRFGRKPEWRRQRRRQIPPADATPKRKMTRLTS